MSQPIGMLRFMDRWGDVSYVEASRISSIVKMNDVPEGEAPTKINLVSGQYWTSKDSAEELADEYDALVRAARLESAVRSG